MIYENIGRRSILKGIGAVMGNPLGLFQKAAVATAKELAANVVVNRNITKCTVDMIPSIINRYAYDDVPIPVINGLVEYHSSLHGKIYLDPNDVGANIAKYYKNDFGKLIVETIGQEGLFNIDKAFGGVFTKLFTNATNYMGPQKLAKAIMDTQGYDVEMFLNAMQDVAKFSNVMTKMFNPSALEVFKSTFDMRGYKEGREGDPWLKASESVVKDMEEYFKNRGVEFNIHNMYRQNHRHLEDADVKTQENKISDDDWMAATHGGYEPGQSQFYSKDRVFESVHCFTNDYRRLLIEGNIDTKSQPCHRKSPEKPITGDKND